VRKTILIIQDFQQREVEVDKVYFLLLASPIMNIPFGLEEGCKFFKLDFFDFRYP